MLHIKADTKRYDRDKWLESHQGNHLCVKRVISWKASGMLWCCNEAVKKDVLNSERGEERSVADLL